MRYFVIPMLLTALLMGASPEVIQYINELESTAKVENRAFGGFDAVRGKEIFTSTHSTKQGKSISCVTCHTINLSSAGKNSITGKVIDPLSPRTNPQRLTNAKDVKKWLRRNFMDVYGREGTTQEKGDVLAYIMKN